MPTISGSLNLVTDRPVDSISEVWVRARETRGQGDGLVVGVNDRVAVSDGAVEFTAVSGAAVLVLVQNGMPIETLPMLVSDEAQQSLRAVVQAAEVAGSAEQQMLEQLSAEVLANVVRAEQYRTEAASSASDAQASRSAAATSESNAKTSETNAKTSETNAGDFAAVAITAATEAVDAMGRATEIAGGDFATQSDLSNAVANALRVDTTMGTRLFFGEHMVYGDTGWRDISADISDRESGRLIIRRIGDQVFVVADALKLTSTGSVALPRLRVNFYPVSRVRGTWNESLSGNTAQGSYNISSTGYFNVYGVGSGPIEINETYLTDRSWPSSSLPGTPA